jgi:hypothetical protein
MQELLKKLNIQHYESDQQLLKEIQKKQETDQKSLEEKHEELLKEMKEMQDKQEERLLKEIQKILSNKQ